jgi:hypothetical protein
VLGCEHDPAADDPKALRPTPTLDVASIAARFPYVSQRTALRRCTRCVLPETMPFVDFAANRARNRSGAVTTTA